MFCTKNETGGLFWRVLFNRMLFGVFLANVIICCLVATKGGPSQYMMAGAMAPLPFLLLGFKLYCKRTYDHSMKYYTHGDTNKGAEAQTPIDKDHRRRDRVATRFGHPALYQKLTVPMVHEKSKHLLAEVYRGRLDGDIGDTASFGDMYTMKRMSKENPGKIASASSSSPFEFVSETNMDYENFKDRSEFNSDRGSLYGGDASTIRPDSPSTLWGGGAGADHKSRGRSSSRASSTDPAPGVTYPQGYHQTPSSALREFSPSPERTLDSTQTRPSPYQYAYSYEDQDERVGNAKSNPTDDHARTLLSSAAPMGRNGDGGFTPYSPERDGEGRVDYFKR